MKLVSIIVPMYNEEEMVELFFSVINNVLSKINLYEFEIIVINDGSTDKTLGKLLKIKKEQFNLGIINFSRNFGHESALAAGLEYASGEAVIVMDADLQDPPELINEMIEKWEEGFKVVNAKRSSRKEDAFLKRWTAKNFYNVINKLSDKINIPENVGNYRLLDRQIVNKIKKLPEKNKVFRVIVPYLGYKTAEVNFIRPKRPAGKTHYNWNNMFKLAIDGITSATIIPLKFSINVGFLISLSSFFYLIILLIKKIFFNSYSVDGWTSLMALILFMGGIQLLFLGCLGEYLGRIFLEIKNRPIYYVDDYFKPKNKENL